MVGVPFPAEHPNFANDMKLQKRIGQLESLIEIRHDMDDAEEASKALHTSLSAKNQDTIMSTFGCPFWTISEAILSYIVVLYSKAFNEATGRTSLSGDVDEIFGDAKDKHKDMTELRNGFYAHHRIEANRHQLFFFPNIPSPGTIKLHPSGQTTRYLMSTSIDVEIVIFCVSKVKEYLSKRIDDLSKSIENDLTFDQKEHLLQTPNAVLFEKHWRENPDRRKDPLTSRKT